MVNVIANVFGLVHESIFFFFLLRKLFVLQTYNLF